MRCSRSALLLHALAALSILCSAAVAQDPGAAVPTGDPAAQQPGTSTTTTTSFPPGFTPTSTGALNNPTPGNEPTVITGVQTTTSAAAPTSTAVPVLDLSETRVPYLLMRPLPDSASGQRRTPRPHSGAYFRGCEADSRIKYAQPQSRLNISAVWAQYDEANSAGFLGLYPPKKGTLRITGVGGIQERGYAFSSATGLISAIQVSSAFLTFPIFANFTFLCNHLYPTELDSQNSGVAGSCQFGPGQVAFSAAIPVNSSHEAGTIWTRVQLIDPSTPALTLACIDVPTSLYNPNRWYWHLMLWLPAATAIVYFVIVVVAKAATTMYARARAYRNRAREGGAPTFFKDRISPTTISVLSGHSLVMSPALLRFATPGCWDIIHHTQFVAALAMMAVRWPDFAYPFLRQAAWASMLGNVTLIQASGSDSQHFDVLATQATLPSGVIGEQMSNPASPLYMDASRPNHLMDLGAGFTGIESYARVIGLHEGDLFGTALVIWLIIIAVTLLLSLLAIAADVCADTIARRRDQDEVTELKDADEINEENRKQGGGYSFLGRFPHSVYGLRLHSKALHGNIMRAVALFHLPITILSVWQLASSDSNSMRSVALAGLAFAIVSVIVPVYLTFRVARLPTAKLYEDVSTLLALGPVYNTFSPGSQLFFVVNMGHSLILGIVVGAAQKSGSAQAIILLVLEILLALASGLWLPWGEGAMMGPVSFLWSVVRVTSAVLMVLLTPLVAFSREACGWITYVILLLQGIFYAGALLVLLVKLIEGAVRLVGRVPFDERTSGRTAGLGGALRRIRRRKYKSLKVGDGRPAKQGRSESSNTSAGILRNAAPAGARQRGGSVPSSRPVSNGGTPIPLQHSRQGSFASYLDSTPNSQGRAVSPHDFAAYYRGGAADDEHIMAALPPTFPGGRWSPPPLRPTPSAPNVGAQAARQRQASASTTTLPASQSAPQSGFVRLTGGRATDAAPWAALPAAGAAAAGRPAPRPQPKRPVSQHADIAQWDEQRRLSQPLDPRSSVHALNAMRPPASASAPQSAPIANKRKGFGGMWRRGATSGDSDSDSDEETTWDGNTTAPPGRGAWAGVSKISAAFRGISGKLGGKSNAEAQESVDGEDSVPPGTSGGFQVVRPPRPSPRAVSAAASPDLDSTALAAATSAAASPALASTATPPAQINYDSPLRSRGAFGMLEADLQREVSSTGHSDHNNDEAFWLPPRTGGEGVVQPTAESGAGTTGTQASRRSQPETQFIEAFDFSPELISSTQKRA